MPTGTHAMLPKPCVSAMPMAGFNKLQKLAASITPPVNPIKTSINPRLRSFTKNTIAAPSAVTNQVNMEPTKPCIMGDIPEKNSSNTSII